MTKYRILLALTVGTSFVALAALLTNVPSVGLFAAIPLMAGGFLEATLTSYEPFKPPLTLLAANAVMYSLFVSLVISLLRPPPEKTRNTALRLMLPAMALSAWACIPYSSPLWPYGKENLVTREQVLQRSLPLGVELNQARAVFKAAGIKPYEGVVDAAHKFRQGDTFMSATRGDRIFTHRIEVAAGEFACGYQIHMSLVFGQDDRLKERAIERFRICI